MFELGQTIVSSNPTSNVAGTATLLSFSTTPNELTEYIISPAVTISGDGNGALAYAYVDTSGNNSTRQISNIVMISHGNNYTRAAATISSNNQYGSGANTTIGISPVEGHGSNTYMELGAQYAGISMTFANGQNEGYKFPITGKFRKIGIIENPEFNDVTVTLNNFTYSTLTVSNTVGAGFSIGEAVIQPSTNAAGIVSYANTTYIQLSNVISPFSANNANDHIYGLYSNTSANTRVANVSHFKLLSNNEVVTDLTTGATATISQIISNTSIRLTNITGHINAGDLLFDAVTNTSATITGMSIANGAVDASSNFGHKFTQTCRIPLTTNSTVAFQVSEYVNQQYSGGFGKVFSYNTDFDITLASSNGTFAVGDTLTDANTSATAIVTFANNTSFYYRCTAQNGSFNAGDTIKNQLNFGGASANVYPALVLTDVNGLFSTGSNPIIGNTSGASGLSSITGSILFPELVRNSGETSYLENLTPFTRSNTSTETVNIVIKF